MNEGGRWTSSLVVIELKNAWQCCNLCELLASESKEIHGCMDGNEMDGWMNR